MRKLALILVAPVLLVSAAPPPSARVVEGFADLADLTLAAPIVLRATVAKAERLNVKEAPDVPPTQARMLVEAAVQAAIVAPGAVAPSVKYLWQTPLDAKGKPPKLKGAPVLLFLRPVPGREDQVTLIAGQGQIAATPAAEATVRRILTERRDPAAALRVTGIANAFHVPGSVPGEAETQIFLTTAAEPVSLVVLSRPGQPQSWSFATGDVIDEAARSIPRNTLLWYRLACALPRALPAAAVKELGDSDRAAAAADYRFVLTSLGPCGRTLR